MGKTIWAIMGTIFILLGIITALGIGSFFVIKAIGFERPDIEITGFFDSDGNPIDGDTQAVVQGVAGVQFITLRINALNRDEVPLTLKILDASPQEFKDALPLNEEIVVQPSQYGSWGSDLVFIVPFEGTDAQFTADIEATSPQRQPNQKTASAILTIGVDPVSDFDVEINPAGNDAIFDEPDCTEAWQCGDWGTCSGNTQTRTCNDLNECGTSIDKPDEEMACVISNVNFRTTDLSYAEGSEIAYTTSCGNVMTGLGAGSRFSFNVPCENQIGIQPVLSGLPVDTNFNDNPSGGDGSLGVYSSGGDAWLCENNADMSGSKAVLFRRSQFDGLVSTSPNSITPTLENFC